MPIGSEGLGEAGVEGGGVVAMGEAMTAGGVSSAWFGVAGSGSRRTSRRAPEAKRPIPITARRAVTTRIQANPRLGSLQTGTGARRRMRGTSVASESVKRAASIPVGAAST